LCPACLLDDAVADQSADSAVTMESSGAQPNPTASMVINKPMAKPLEIIRYFGDYELQDEIARGGMGIVYRAKQVSLNRIVALKMILAGKFADESDVRRF